MNRALQLEEIRKTACWDVLVIGGGATGLGVALDAAARGYRTLLLEQADFAKGTSSRSTKLVHGGVRYLEQGNLKLVFEALWERGHLLQNAPHLVRKQAFLIPVYTYRDRLLYTVGLKLYDYMAGKWRIGRSSFLPAARVKEIFPTIAGGGLKGGIVYYDGQFDDARLAVNLAQTICEQGGAALNYMKVTQLLKDPAGRLTGVRAVDGEGGEAFDIYARAVVNATGVFVDDVLQMDEPGQRQTVQPSQGVHIVLDKKFLGGSSYAMMIPATPDGRVLFAVPWHERLLVGTTDTLVKTHSLEPLPLKKEVDFILETAGKYLALKPVKKDVLSVFAGLRPLALPEKETKSTKDISRGHKLMISASGLVTITGGKWTTFRRMAQDTVDKVIAVAALPARKCRTKNMKIHGSEGSAGNWHQWKDVYGSDRQAIEQLAAQEPGLEERLHSSWPFTAAEVIWSVRGEMARTVEDMLARRFRVLFLDAKAAVEMAPAVAALMAKELKKDRQWEQDQLQQFSKVAQHYFIDASAMPGVNNAPGIAHHTNND